MDWFSLGCCMSDWRMDYCGHSLLRYPLPTTSLPSSFHLRPLSPRPFPPTAGNVVFAEIMLLPNGMSKGCGCVLLSFLSRRLFADFTIPPSRSVVEFSQPEEAQRAVRELNDQQLLGRPLFIREVRLPSRVLPPLFVR